MTRTRALLLGLATLWPFVYFLISMLMIGAMVVFTLTADAHGDGEDFFTTVFFTMFTLHMLTLLLVVALVAIYLVHLFKTDGVPQDKKALWAVVLLLGNMFAMPVYWYLYVWRDVPAPPETGAISQETP